MKSALLKLAVSAACLTGAAPAFADLVYVNGAQNTGTGLGAVNTLVTVQDNGGGNPARNGLESGCVTYAGSLSSPSTACQLSLQGGDNHSGSAGNNLYLASSIDGLNSADELGLVLNISEGGPGGTATLTDIYLSLFNTLTNTLTTYAYAGPDLILGDTGGIGQSGTHRFVLNDDQAADALLACPVLSQCVIGGGVQFFGGTTESTPETVYVGGFLRDDTGGPGGGEVPEPASLALLGAGALALGMMRRRYDAKK